MKYELIDIYIGQRLFEARKMKNVSMETAGARFGVTKQRLYNYEKGKRSMPFDLFKKFCAYYGLDALELFTEAQEHMRKETFK